MVVFFHETHDSNGFAEFLGLFVGPIGRGQRLKNIGNGHYPGRHRHVIPLQASRVTGAVHFFMVPARKSRHMAQVLGVGQLFQHDDGLHDVIVDFVPLFVRECAALDGEDSGELRTAVDELTGLTYKMTETLYAELGGNDGES